jgi:hypothetical protein
MHSYSGQRDRVFISLEQDIQAHGFVNHVDIDDLDFHVLTFFHRFEPGGDFQQVVDTQPLIFQLGPDLGKITAVELINAHNRKTEATKHIVNHLRIISVFHGWLPTEEKLPGGGSDLFFAIVINYSPEKINTARTFLQIEIKKKICYNFLHYL